MRAMYLSILAVAAALTAAAESRADMIEVKRRAFEEGATFGGEVHFEALSGGHSPRAVIELEFYGFQEDGAPLEKKVLLMAKGSVGLARDASGVSVPAARIELVPYHREFSDGLNSFAVQLGRIEYERDVALGLQSGVRIRALSAGISSSDSHFAEASIGLLGAAFKTLLISDHHEVSTAAFHVGSMGFGMGLQGKLSEAFEAKWTMVGFGIGMDMVTARSAIPESFTANKISAEVDAWSSLEMMFRNGNTGAPLGSIHIRGGVKAKPPAVIPTENLPYTSPHYFYLQIGVSTRF